MNRSGMLSRRSITAAKASGARTIDGAGTSGRPGRLLTSVRRSKRHADDGGQFGDRRRWRRDGGCRLRQAGGPDLCQRRRTRHQAPQARQGLCLPAGRRQPGARSRDPRPHPHAGDPAGLDRRLDLRRRRRPSAGDGTRSARPQAVPLPRALVGQPRRGEIFEPRRVRARPARQSASGSTAICASANCRASASSPRSSGCSTTR